jgi:hypothetical protein
MNTPLNRFTKGSGFVVEPSETRYEIYCTFADDGQGGDINRQGQPLKTFEEWLNS